MSGILDVPESAAALLVLAHGAGAGMEHEGMQSLASALNGEGIATLRFQFPYMEKKSRRPDLPKIAVASIVAAVEAGRKALPKLPLFAGGKSFGGRMTTTAASEKRIDVRGIVCFGFPLHPAKKPGTERAEHLSRVDTPMLWIQGTRDDLAELSLVRKVVKEHPAITLYVVEGADHGYGVLKSSGRRAQDVRQEVARVTVGFVRGH